MHVFMKGIKAPANCYTEMSNFEFMIKDKYSKEFKLDSLNIYD